MHPNRSDLPSEGAPSAIGRRRPDLMARLACLLALVFAMSGLSFILVRSALASGLGWPEREAPGLSQAAPGAQAVVDGCGTITSTTTWATGNTYAVNNCNVTVPAGVTLTVEAGVVVKFGGVAPGYASGPNSAALIVNGALVANGTSGQPVVFTSLADDAHGGDTNADGPSAGAAGQWYGVRFGPGSTGRLEHAFVGYAGSGTFNAGLGNYGRAQIDVLSSDVHIRNTQVISGSQKGIFLEGAGLTPVILDTHVAGNKVGNGTGYAIAQQNFNMQPTFANLTFAENDRNEVVIERSSDTITMSLTLSGTVYGFSCGYTPCLTTIPNGITVTVGPGTLLDFRPTFGIAVASGGALVAEGTASQPITFTSRLAAQTAGQEWMGLWAQKGGKLRLDQCDVSYATNTNYGQGGLQIDATDVEVRNCRIHHNLYDGVYIKADTNTTIEPRLDNVRLTDNGAYGIYMIAYANGALNLTMESSVISASGKAGIYHWYEGGQVNPVLRNMTIADNGSAGSDGRDKNGITLGYKGVSPTLENVAFTGNTGSAMYWTSDGSITASNVTASGNGTDALTTGGGIYAARNWKLADAGIPIHVVGDIAIQPNALLSLDPGTTLRFASNIYLRVQRGSLFALGTPEKPITFTGIAETPGAWNGLYLEGSTGGTGTLVLKHCDIGYGNTSNVLLYGFTGQPSDTVVIQNCRIHDSKEAGIRNYYISPVIRNNEIYSNTTFGVLKSGTTVMDARQNYWGDATGPYHATLNPGGQGNEVGYGSLVLFDPYLAAPPTTTASLGTVLVATGGPSLVSPGQTTDYAIQVINLMTTTVSDTVLMLQLPQAADYAGSTHGGLHWEERNQVYWKLGALAPGAEVLVSAQARFQWGLPADYRDGSLTILAGSNYNAGALDVAEYNGYAPITVTSQSALSQADFDALRAAHPDLETLYSQSLAQGYGYLESGRVTLSDGSIVSGTVLRTADRRYVRLLTHSDGQSLAVTFGDGLYVLHDTTGGMTTTLHALTREYWGDWVADTGGDIAGESGVSAQACTAARCKTNCIGKKVTFKYVVSSVAKTFLWTIGTGGTGGLASGAYHTVHVAKMIYDCNKECNADANSNCCTAGQVRWSPSGWIKFFGGSACVKEECNATTGNYGTPGTIYCAFGQRCVAGYGGNGGCRNCSEGAGDIVQYSEVMIRPPESGEAPCALSASSTSKCSDVGLLLAKDPNAIYGPAGDVMPGELVTYTVTYENEGAGRAYGVYVVNDLPASFDESSLSILGGGVYLPADRQLLWVVGELGPKGDSDSEGAVTYTVRLKTGLPSGTVVRNQAVVYFPSVPEETPTNVWVNVVSPLVAEPQSLTTGYGAPLTVTLSGREISGLPLTYTIADGPQGGTLAGTAPTLVYTPAAGFSGPDRFTFKVSNGLTESRPAQVDILVSSLGDADPPQVLWVQPAGEAQNVAAPSTANYTDTMGPAYAPIIAIGFSEALSDTTVNTQTVRLTDAAGQSISRTVSYDGLMHQVILAPRAPLQASAMYTATVTIGITDAAGNPLAADYTWRFTTAAPARRYLYLPVILREP